VLPVMVIAAGADFQVWVLAALCKMKLPCYLVEAQALAEESRNQAQPPPG
jgi:hypothetical protein